MMQWSKDDVYKEIDLIQSCITRMASNSFYIKGWHIGLLTALVAFFVSREKVDYTVLFCLTLIITIIFWFLDSYYLLFERKYRWKYQWVIANRIKTNGVAIDASNYLNLDPNEETMWDNDPNNAGIKAAKNSIAHKDNAFIIKLLFHFRELWLVMRSGTMIVQYFTVSIISLIGLIINISI